MPIYSGEPLDIPIGPGCEFETIEEAMMIREKDNVPRSEDCDFSGGRVFTEEEKKEMEDFADLVMKGLRPDKVKEITKQITMSLVAANLIMKGN